MHIPLERLATFVVGADTTTVTDGALAIRRLPPALYELYKANVGSQQRADCSTGVRLRFASDTTQVRLSLRYGEPVRWVFQGAALIEGATPTTFGPTEKPDPWSGTITVNGARRLRRFDLWFPHLCPTELVALEIDDDSRFAPAPPFALRWLAYGDSLTQGMTATLPHLTWTGICALALNAELHNFGVGGATMKAELADAPTMGPADLITILYGANDCNIGIAADTVATNGRRLLESLTARHPGARIVLMTPLHAPGYRPGTPGGWELAPYRAGLEAVAAAFPNVTLVPGTSLIPDDQQYFVDKCHANNIGNASWARNLLPTLQKLFRKD